MGKALITGASSGIGKSIALYLNELNYDLILVGRDQNKLQETAKLCKNVKILTFDLSKDNEVKALYAKVKDENIDLLVNDAGFGLFGYFEETPLDKELMMIDLNVKAVHILTKLFLQDFVKKNNGYILNVASSAGFLAGPYLSTYYATKNYVLKLTMAINEELKARGKNVHISALCPGPVDTNFNNVAGGHFNTKSLTSDYVAKYAIDEMLKNKMIIIPSFKMKAGIFFSRLIPYRLMLKITYKIQINKTK
jgi:uncharacterized protein